MVFRGEMFSFKVILATVHVSASLATQSARYRSVKVLGEVKGGKLLAGLCCHASTPWTGHLTLSTINSFHSNLIFYFIPLCIWDTWTWRLFLVLQTRSQYWQWYSEGKCFDSRWFFAWSLSLLTLPHNPHEMERSKFFVKYIFASSSIENETPSGRSPGESEGQIINGSLFNSSMLQRHVLSQAILTMANFITETTWILRGKMFGL